VTDFDLVGRWAPVPDAVRAGPAVLVGGGYGDGPAHPVPQALIAAGSPVEIVTGASTASRLFGELVARRAVGR